MKYLTLAAILIASGCVDARRQGDLSRFASFNSNGEGGGSSGNGSGNGSGSGNAPRVQNDPVFGTQGLVAISSLNQPGSPGSTFERVADLAVHADDSMSVLYSSTTGSGTTLTRRWTIQKFSTTGTPLPVVHSGVYPSGSDMRPVRAFFQSDSKVIVLHLSSTQLVLERYLVQGTLDSSFLTTTSGTGITNGRLVSNKSNDSVAHVAIGASWITPDINNPNFQNTRGAMSIALIEELNPQPQLFTRYRLKHFYAIQSTAQGYFTLVTASGYGWYSSDQAVVGVGLGHTFGSVRTMVREAASGLGNSAHALISTTTRRTDGTYDGRVFATDAQGLLSAFPILSPIPSPHLESIEFNTAFGVHAIVRRSDFQWSNNIPVQLNRFLGGGPGGTLDTQVMAGVSSNLSEAVVSTVTDSSRRTWVLTSDSLVRTLPFDPFGSTQALIGGGFDGAYGVVPVAELGVTSGSQILGLAVDTQARLVFVKNADTAQASLVRLIP